MTTNKSFQRALLSGLTVICMIAGACQDKKSKESEATVLCYSPTQNLDQAYIENSIGCECADGTPGVCKSQSETGLDRNVALVCSEGKWAAVQDGPCGLQPY